MKYPVQNHWKEVGKITNKLLTNLNDKISYKVFSELSCSKKRCFCHYLLIKNKEIDIRFYKVKQSNSSGVCRLVSQDNHQRIELNCYFDQCDKESYEHMLKVTLLHEVTHAMQYILNLFSQEPSHRFDQNFMQEAEWFVYMTQKSEIDAELSTFFNLYNSINIDKIPQHYNQYVNVPTNVLKAVAKFVTQFLLTGVYDENLRQKLWESL